MGSDGSSDEETVEGLLCIVCSSLMISGDKEESNAGTGLTNNTPFSRFCGELEVCDKNDGSVNTGKHLFTAINFLRTLERSSDYYCMCSKCLQLISESMEKKLKVDEVEYQVIELQVQLLHKMKALQQCTNLYFQELFKIYEKVRSAEVSSVEKRQIKMHKELGKRHVHHYTKCDVLQFREKIMNVVTYLGIFQDNLQQKLVEDTEESMEDQVITVPEQTSKSNIPNQAQGKKPPRRSSRKRLPLSPTTTDDDEEDKSDNNLDDYDWSGADDNHGDEDGLDQESETLDLLATIKTEVDENITEEREDREDASNSEGDYSEASSISDTGKKRKASKKRNTRNSPVKTAVIKRKPADRKKLDGFKVAKGAQQNPKLLLVDYTDMGPLKKHIIMRILNCHLLLVTNLVPAGSEGVTVSNKNKDLKQIHLWDYDLPTDRITLSGRNINLEENEALNELTLGCAACDFQYQYSFMISEDKKKSAQILSLGMEVLQRNLFDHVVGQHLNGFQCPECHQISASYKTYQDHLKTHGMEKKFTCDQCGASFHKRWSFRRHMVVHMTGEERQEAYNQYRTSATTGKAFPSASKPRKKPASYDYQCTTCGKEFWKLQHLQIHEESHKDKDARPMIVCPLCGTKILMVSYSKHKKNYCSAMREKQPPPACTECGKTFATQKYLKEHMIRKHTEFNLQMPFHCGDCGTRFKLKKDLRQHELNVHLHRKELACAKGCGKKFVFEISLQKHEAKCQRN